MTNDGRKHIKLENGMNVYLEKTPSKRVVSQLRLNFGAGYEAQDERGLAHFLEHCYAKSSSENYKAEELEDMTKKLYSWNAFSSQGRTWTEGSMLPAYTEDWLNFSSETMFNSKIESAVVEGERQRVLTEINEHLSNPSFASKEEVRRVLYGNHIKGINPLGDSLIVAIATREKMLQMYHDNYSPTSADLFLAGGLPDNTEEMVLKYFSEIPKGKNIRVDIPTLEKLSTKTTLCRDAPWLLNSSNIRESAGEFGVLWRIPNQTGIRRHSLNFLSSTLGNSIQDKLSNKMAISYVAGANLDWDYNVGTLSMTGKARSADLADAISGCFDVVGTLKNNAVSRAEIDSYKRRIEYSFAANEETVEGKLSILMGELDGQENVKEFFEGVSAITPESVMEAANYALPDSDGDYILSILDPLKDNE